MNIVHAADLHLDSPLRGLSRYTGAPVERIRGATRRALSNLVELCLEEEAGLLLLAGDLFDGEWRDYSTGLFFAAQMSRLREAAGIPVVVIRGNHDAESQISRHLKLPDNVHVLSTREPQTLRFPELKIAVHGQSFFDRVVTQDLASAYPLPVPGWFNVGLLHTAVGGRPGHEPYAPCSLETLISKGYDYWALGHVHTREVLCEDPPIVFPGNLQGRHIREQGEKGATIVRLAEGRVLECVHRPVDEVRFVLCDVDATGAEDREALLDSVRASLGDAVRLAEGRLVCARVRIAGATGLHAGLHHERERLENDVRMLGNDFGGDLWIEKVKLETQPQHDPTALRQQGGALGQMLCAVDALRNDPHELAGLASLFEELKRKLPLELRQGPEGLLLEDPDFMDEMLAEVEPLLLARLLGEGSEG